MKITCCFTGHRSISPNVKKKIEKRFENEIIHLVDQGVTTFLCGGALGFDTLAAHCVLRLKQHYPQVQLWLVLPCRNQAEGWAESDRVVYDQIKRQADRVIYTSDTYWPGCMHKRNRFLADHSYWCICYLNQPGGGTRYTVETCLQKGVRVINLADETPSRGDQ